MSGAGRRGPARRLSAAVGAVAFQGERGAYSEEAVLRHFGAAADVLPCRTFAEVFRAVEDGTAVAGMVPIENSLAGSINETYDLLLRHSLTITGETVLRVRHCLLAPPGQTLEDLRQVCSHPQALAQCADFLSRHGLEPVAVYDTAGGAKTLGKSRAPGVGVIASRRSAELYGLEVLAEGIESDQGNYTRFYAIARPGGDQAGAGASSGRHPQGKTVLVFATSHRPGSLYWCLGAFAFRGIDLLKLESRPVHGRPWEYLFYADVRGLATDGDVQEALAELRTKATSVRVLGSFVSGENEPSSRS